MPYALLTYLRAALVVLVLNTGASALAQEGSPAAGVVGPQVGDAVSLFATDGQEQARAAVTRLVDPFPDVTVVGDAPSSDSHIVLVELTIENLSATPIDVKAIALQVADSQGETHLLTFDVVPTPGAAMPSIGIGGIAAGATNRGSLLYEVPNGRSVAQLVLPYGSGQFAILVDQGRTDEGEAAPIHDESGEEIGTVSVDAIVVGLEETDPTIDIEPGQTGVAVVLTVTNTGGVDLESPAASMWLLDKRNVAYVPYLTFRNEASLAELPDLARDDIPVGETVTGVVVFSLPLDAVVAHVLYLQPGLTVFDIVGRPGAEVVSAVNADIVIPPTIPVAATATSDEAAACGGVADWAAITRDNLSALEQRLAEFGVDTPQDLSLAELRGAADVILATVDAQRGLNVPDPAVTTNDALATFLEAYAGFLSDAAAEIEAGADPAQVFDDDFTSFGSIVGRSRDALLIAQDRLRSVCPGVDLGL